MAKAKDQEQTKITFAQAAQIVGTTEDEISRLSRMSVIPRNTRSRTVPIFDFVRQYCAHLRNQQTSIDGVAEAVGLSGLMVRNIIDAGFVKRLPNGFLMREEAIIGVLNYYRDERRNSTKVQAERGLKEARQREIEMRIAREENKLIETEAALDAVDEIIGTLRSGLTGIAARVTRNLDLRRTIETELDAVLDRASGKLEERAAALRAGGSASEAEAEDDA